MQCKCELCRLHLRGTWLVYRPQTSHFLLPKERRRQSLGSRDPADRPGPLNSTVYKSVRNSAHRSSSRPIGSGSMHFLFLVINLVIIDNKDNDNNNNHNQQWETISNNKGFQIHPQNLGDKLLLYKDCS